MVLKINDPCPCLSGKKYKNCCLLKDEPRSFTHKLIIKKSEELIPRLMAYAEESWGYELFEEAWEEFSGGQMEENPEDSPYEDMFIRWFLFLWVPQIYFEEEICYPSKYTLVADFLEKNYEHLDSLSNRYLQSALADPLSFWQVEAVKKGRGAILKDLLLGREVFVEDETASRHLNKWDVILANLIELDGTYGFNILGPFSLPASVKEDILDEFSDMLKGETEKESIQELFQLDIDLIWFYFDLMEDLVTAEPPEMRNMDGERIVITRSLYKFDPSDRQAILNILSTKEDFDHGPIASGERLIFVWTKKVDSSSLEHVVKGTIEIRQEYLETECNSAERDKELRKTLWGLLSDKITHKKTTSEKLDPSQLTAASTKGQADRIDILRLEDLPEDVQAGITEKMEAIYMSWADKPVPALGNLTPREAVKDESGKEMVISLINDWENTQARMEDPQFIFDFNKLRKELGLPLE